MGYIPGKSRTKVVPEGRRFQLRYYDPEVRVWFDLGDPRDTEAEARALLQDFEENATRKVFRTRDSKWSKHNGREIREAEPMNPDAYDEAEVGPMFIVRFVDGDDSDYIEAFGDEIVDEKED